MAHVTYFVAMPFVRNEEGELVAGEAQDIDEAISVLAPFFTRHLVAAGGVRQAAA